MKDKTTFKKWWFWVIVVVVLGAIGAATQSSSNTTNTTSRPSTQKTTDNNTSELPVINVSDYKGKEGLAAYKELKAKGYAVDADFENEALTDINGKASAIFEPLDVNKSDDRQSVDAFLVGDITQNGDSVKLIIVKSSS